MPGQAAPVREKKQEMASEKLRIGNRMRAQKETR